MAEAKKASIPWQEQAYQLIHEPYKNLPNHGIKEEWLAGLISVECARLDPKASRKEPHVIADIMRVKDGGRAKSFPGFNSGPIKAFIQHCSDRQALESLGTSYGLGQIMGYHYVSKWGVQPSVYTNLTVEKSIRYMLAMMGTGLEFASQTAPNDEKSNFQQLARWWNTGSVNGKTYHANYADNAWNMVLKYRKLLEDKVS